MELKDFIKNVIKDITLSVVELQEEAMLNNSGMIINPSLSNDGYIDYKKGKRKVSVIEFYVGITEISNDTAKGGLGVVTGFISGGASKEHKKENQSLSNIRFDIPIALPVSDGLEKDTPKWGGSGVH